MPRTRSEILAQIRAAFPAYPIQTAGALDERWTSYLDPVVFCRYIEGKTWEQLDSGYLERHTDALSFLSIKSLVAVLPAYLCIFIEQGTRTQAPASLRLNLNRKQRRFEELFGALTSMQRDAVAATLDALAAMEKGQPERTARTAAERWQIMNRSCRGSSAAECDQ